MNKKKKKLTWLPAEYESDAGYSESTNEKGETAISVGNKKNYCIINKNGIFFNGYLKILKNWEKATQKLADYFVKRYFGKDADWYFVGDEVGDILFVNDYFFSLDDMVQFLRCEYPADKMFEYYDKRLDNDMKNKAPFPNIKNYLKC